MSRYEWQCALKCFILKAYTYALYAVLVSGFNEGRQTMVLYSNTFLVHRLNSIVRMVRFLFYIRSKILVVLGVLSFC